MSLKEFLALTDPALKAEFDRQAPDVKALRKAAIKRVDKAIRQLTSDKPPRKPDLFEINNNVVQAKLPFMVSHPKGEDYEFTMPYERSAEAFGKLKAAIENGEVDKQLVEASEGHTYEITATAKKPRKPRDPWTPEERERRAAARAARNAAKSGE